MIYSNMSRSSQYWRERAERTLVKMAETSDFLVQQQLLRVAKEYTRLAEMAELNLPDAEIGPAASLH